MHTPFYLDSKGINTYEHISIADISIADIVNHRICTSSVAIGYKFTLPVIYCTVWYRACQVREFKSLARVIGEMSILKQSLFVPVDKECMRIVNKFQSRLLN